MPNPELQNPRILGVGQGAKVLHAIITQTGANAPVMLPDNIIVNTLGNHNRPSFTWAYDGIGAYRLVSPGSFKGKVTAIVQVSTTIWFGALVYVNNPDDNTVALDIRDTATSPLELEGTAFIYIYVWPTKYSS